MYFTNEQARTQQVTASSKIMSLFPQECEEGALDAEFFTADRSDALGVTGLPFQAPVCEHLLAQCEIANYLEQYEGSQLLILTAIGSDNCAGDSQSDSNCAHESQTNQNNNKSDRKYSLVHLTRQGEAELPDEIARKMLSVIGRVLESPGHLNENGELILDLKTYPVGPHYPVNLLLGNRAGYPYPLCTTPKSALDSLGRGSFRATGGQQVLATRCVLSPEENGEPVNRQFYLSENGRQIFWSANVNENTASAYCCHSQNRTVITYETECGLAIQRTIFILPQEDGMPGATEAQRVEITNHSVRERTLKIVMTGMFGITNPTTIANDVVFANIVVENEVFYRDGKAAALTLHHKPWEQAGEKRFALLLCKGETMDDFCVSQPDFIGSGSVDHPEFVGHLPSRYNRKMAPFFAMGKTFTVAPGETVIIDEFVGMVESDEANAAKDLGSALGVLMEKYENPAALAGTLGDVVEFWKRYPSYLTPQTGDERFNSYVSHNLPFQVLYQTYVSRAFAWTQKSYRETGFREIQDIYASMYYLSAIGENDLIKNLISNWVRSVFRMGYAYHDFTFDGKDPGGCSDDQLWLLQAVYRYVTLTGDAGFLLEEYPIAGEDGAKRLLWDTIMSILTYSGRISIGKHGMPLLDRADWNDTLRLDRDVLNGPQKEEAYRAQLEEKNQPYGTPFENELTESVMNACLFIIAADEAAELGAMIGKDADVAEARALSAGMAQSMQENAWKGDFFARCLINSKRKGGYTYLGAQGDGLALDDDMDGTYFLNSYSWPILAGVATEEQIRIMLGRVQKYLKTDAGLRLCTLVAFDRLEIGTATGLYFPGDRENGGVFKHAAMMATTASLQAAKKVTDEALAKELAELAFFMIGKTMPYRTLDDPFVLKGNPRFCTQYNNSETGENIGPMLSGTASWLTLAIYENMGVNVQGEEITFDPILNPETDALCYTLHLADASIEVEITGDGSRFRTGDTTRYTYDGKESDGRIAKPDGGCHKMIIQL